jgi:two-component system phosphate regulon response regulator PhoB
MTTDKEQILVVDDEEDILNLVCYNLKADGYRVLTAGSGEDALEMARSRIPDMIILDLMLPGISGMEAAAILKSDKKTRHIPIIMLTAKGGERDVVAGLEAGADDYVTKPFSPMILKARIKTVLQRRSSVSEKTGAAPPVEGLVIDSGKRKVFIHDQEAALSYTEFEILQYLCKRPGWVFTRSQIVDAVRGDNYPVTDRSVDVQIAGLRKKMGSYGKYIETVRGVGYRFKEND